MALYKFYLVTYLPPIAVFRKVCFYAGITKPISRLLPTVAEVTQTPKSLSNAFIFHSLYFPSLLFYTTMLFHSFWRWIKSSLTSIQNS